MSTPSVLGSSTTPSLPETATTQRSRLEWVDLVKSVSVLLVVLMHFVLTLLNVTGTPVTEFWHGFIAVLEPLRMPTFFVVSGMLAAGAVKRPWRTSRRRTFGTAYLYVLWSAILFLTVMATTWTGSFTGSLTGSLTSFLGGLLFPSDGYWFLYALILYFVIAKLARNWPAWLLVGAAAILSLFRVQTVDIVHAALQPLHAPGMLHAVVLNLVFFLFGVYYRDIVLRLADAARWPIVLVLGGAAVILSVMRFQDADQWANLFLLLSVLWVATGVMLARLLTNWQGPRRFGSFLGTRTLPIFVLQFPLLVLTRVWLADSPPGFLHTTIGQLIYPLVATALVAAIGIGLYTIAQSSVMRYLFTAPDWAVSPGPTSPSSAKRRKLASENEPAQAPQTVPTA